MERKEELIWDRFSGIYDSVIKKDKNAYDFMIKDIISTLNSDDFILEIATGTGIISLGLANSSKEFKNIEATDFSSEMILRAKEKAEKLNIDNVKFSIQNAYDLKYDDNAFDSVIISNTLHIMPNAEKALEEIKRVLKTNGLLIAPTFVHANSVKGKILSKIFSVTGFRAYHKWTEKTFHLYLKENGFKIVKHELLKASFPLAYVVAVVARQ